MQQNQKLINISLLYVHKHYHKMFLFTLALKIVPVQSPDSFTYIPDDISHLTNFTGLPGIVKARWKFQNELMFIA